MRNHKKSISLTTKERAFPLLVFELICHSRKDLPLIFMIGKNSEFWGLFTAEFFFSAKFSKGSQKLVIYLSSDIGQAEDWNKNWVSTQKYFNTLFYLLRYFCFKRQPVLFISSVLLKKRKTYLFNKVVILGSSFDLIWRSRTHEQQHSTFIK